MIGSDLKKKLKMSHYSVWIVHQSIVFKTNLLCNHYLRFKIAEMLDDGHANNASHVIEHAFLHTRQKLPHFLPG